MHDSLRGFGGNVRCKGESDSGAKPLRLSADVSPILNHGFGGNVRCPCVPVACFALDLVSPDQPQRFATLPLLRS